MEKLNRIKYLMYLLLLLILLARQWQMESEISCLQESELKFKQEMIQFMNSTNSSVESLSAASKANTKSLKIIAGIQ